MKGVANDVQVHLLLQEDFSCLIRNDVTLSSYLPSQ